MPTKLTNATRKPLRPCWHRACAALTSDGACSRHPRPTYGWKPDRERGSRQDRGYGAAWEHLRLEVLERDGYLCQIGRGRGSCTIDATEVDHIIPKAAGGSDELENLQAVCPTCHRAKTDRDATNQRRGGRSENENPGRQDRRLSQSHTSTLETPGSGRDRDRRG